MQTLIVAVLVIGCTAYAVWTLMPAAARRAVAAAMATLPLPNALGARMRKAATVPAGCGCDGCDHALSEQAAPVAPQVVTFRPRPPR